MSPRERRGAAGLLARQSASDAWLLALVALVVAVAALLVTAAPAALASVSTREVRHTLEEFPAVRRDLSASAAFGYPSGGGRSTAEGLAAITDSLEAATVGLAPPLGPLLSAPQWAAVTDREAVRIRDARSDEVGLALGLAVTPDGTSRISVVEGVLPSAWSGDDGDPARSAAGGPVQIALARAAAEAMGIEVGALLEGGVVPLQVTGVYEPLDPGDSFWLHQPTLATAQERRADDGRRLIVADALIDPESTAGLATAFADARLQAWYPLDTAGLTFDRAAAVAQQVRELSATGRILPTGEFLLFSSIQAADLDGIIERVRVAGALMALLIAGPIGVVLAVLALSARAIGQRRAPALALARVRGASSAQLRVGLLLEGVVIALPAAAIGVAVAAAGGAAAGLDAETAAAAWPAVAAIVVVPPLLLAANVPSAPRTRGPHAADLRWVGEVVVLLLAAASVFLLVRRGVMESAERFDPLLAAAPLLVAAAGTLVVLRVYPLLMRLARRRARRSRGVVALVGTARAAHEPTLGFATAFALVVGVSVAVFSLATAATLRAALTATQTATRREIPPLDAGHPLVAGIFALLALAVGTTLLFSLLAVVLGVISTSAQRDGVVGILGVLGLRRSGLRAVVVWEIAPVTLVAIIAGVVLGLVEVIVVVAAIDLPAFAGAPPSAPRVDALGIAAVVAAVAVSIILVALVAAAITGRRSPATSLRMGMR